MSTEIVVTLITTVGTILVAAVGVLAKQGVSLRRTVHAVREDTAATRHQVQNDHSSNLREDMDHIRDSLGERLDDVIVGLNRVIDGQTTHGHRLREHGQSLGRFGDDLRVEREERLALAVRVDSHIASSD